MVVAVWSVKGGVGVSSVAALLAIGQVERAEDVLLVDLDGDLPALLGLEDPTGAPGLAEWCAMSDPAPDALQRLEVEARSGLRIIPRGSGPFANSAAPLMTALASYRRQVIVDCGVIRSDDTMASDLILRADQSLLVARECYLTLRALREQTLVRHGVIVLKESRRVLGRADVESVAMAPVIAEVAIDSSVARAIDSGLLAARLPRSLLKAMGKVVTQRVA